MTTKLGLMADIHADTESLYHALSIFDDISVDAILCAGDIAGKGPHNDQTIQILQAYDIPCVMGNHDELAAGIRASMYPMVSYQVNSTSKDYLENLPYTLRYSYEGISLCVGHATSTSTINGIHRNSEESFIHRAIEEAEADVLIVGHTHTPLRIKTRSAWIFNPGSVCQWSMHDSGTCAILTLPDMTFDVYEVDSRNRAFFHQQSI